MDKYYYLVAELPALFFGRRISITPESFLSEARKWLGERDYALLTTADLTAPAAAGEKAPEALKEYCRFESQLQTDIAHWRKTQNTAGEHKPLSFPVAVVKDSNPLEAEKKLLELRWKYLENLETGHHFDLDLLILYFLKLQILKRLFQFNKNTGFIKFQALCEVTV